MLCRVRFREYRALSATDVMGVRRRTLCSGVRRRQSSGIAGRI